MAKIKGVFCLEGDWWGLHDRTTVEPVLELLSLHGDYRVPYVHRDVGTVEEFDHYLRKWTQKSFAKYPILYLGFHGDPGVLYVGEGKGQKGQLDLVSLGERLEGACKGRLIHFGSCGTMDQHGARLNAFLKQTGALAICGYRAQVDWIPSTAFDLLWLGHLQKGAFTKASVRAAHTRLLKEAPGLAKALRFRLVLAA